MPVSNWTLKLEGSKQLAIVGLEDKRQITAVMCGSADGVLLPLQLLYTGKTDVCHPKFNFASNWDIFHIVNHWSNSDFMEQCVDTIISPYMTATRKRLRSC